MSNLSRVTAGMILITATIVGGSISALALLKKGTDGAAVEVLQDKLKAKNHFRGRSDGDFGGITENAVKAFQRSKGLKADGKVGDATWRKLTGAPKKPILKKGEGPKVSVETLQRKLGLRQDGDFGRKTEDKVKAYQRSQGIVDNGKVEADMRYMLDWGR